MNDADILRKSLDKAFGQIAELANHLHRARDEIKNLHGRLDNHSARHAGHAQRFQKLV